MSYRKDIDKALKYFSKSAALGNADAAHQIASYNLFQENGKKKKKLGFKYLTTEYENGSAYSAGKLGWAYQDGLGTEKNLEKAKKLQVMTHISLTSPLNSMHPLTRRYMRKTIDRMIVTYLSN